MPFSERYGYKSARQALQLDGIDRELRNGLWNVLHEKFLSNWADGIGHWGSRGENLSRAIWKHFYKLPITDRPAFPKRALEFVEEDFFKRPWFEIYDLIEFLVGTTSGPEQKIFVSMVDSVLEREMSAYRLVGTEIVSITSPEEIDAIVAAEALSNAFAPVAEHIKLQSENYPTGGDLTIAIRSRNRFPLWNPFAGWLPEKENLATRLKFWRKGASPCILP